MSDMQSDPFVLHTFVAQKGYQNEFLILHERFLFCHGIKINTEMVIWQLRIYLSIFYLRDKLHEHED